MSASPFPRALRIVVINNEATFLYLMETFLVEEGYEVHTYQQGDQALAFVKATKPDLVMLDIVLEHRDSGWRILQSLHDDSETTQLPVLVCTADARSIEAHQAQLEGDQFATLLKPFDLDDLLVTLKTLWPLWTQEEPVPLQPVRLQPVRLLV